jgi:DNA polymerase-3 subunit alpha
MAGQMSLFDLVSEEQKQEYTVRLPDVPEFEKEELLGFEKEVLGIYLSGHPLEDHLDKIKKNSTAKAVDFIREEETGALTVRDNDRVIVGGMIAGKNVKYTRNNQAMAFLTLEDLTGSVEIIVFPRQYGAYQNFLGQDEKVFVVGRATVEDEQDGKIICERIVPFDDLPHEVWLKFDTKEAYADKENSLYGILQDSHGADEVCIYVEQPKSVKKLGKQWSVHADSDLLERLKGFLGEKNVKLVEKSIEKR